MASRAHIMGAVLEVPILLRADPSEEREAKLLEGGRAREGRRAKGLRQVAVTLNPPQSDGTTHIVKSSVGSMQRLVALAPEVRVDRLDDGFKAANAADQTPSLRLNRKFVGPISQHSFDI